MASLTSFLGKRPDVPSDVRRLLSEALAPPEVPIKATKLDWVVTGKPEKLVRTFTFDDSRRMRLFILGIIDLEEDLGHNGLIQICEGKVKIEVWTRSLEEVTELDMEYAHAVDDVYEDVKFYNLDV